MTAPVAKVARGSHPRWLSDCRLNFPSPYNSRTFLPQHFDFSLFDICTARLIVNQHISRKHLSPCQTPTINITTTLPLLPIQPLHQQLQTTAQATTTNPTPRKTSTNTSRREGTDTRTRTLRRIRIRSTGGIRARLVFRRRSMGLRHRSNRRRHSRVRLHCILLSSMGMDMGMGMRIIR